MAQYRRARPKRKKIYLQSTKAAPNTAPSAHVATATNAANFLTIPGELRNKIYRLALISADRILIAKGQFEEPSLLLACRQIRTEATTIYYLENVWRIDCPGWDHTIYQAFFRHVKTVCDLRNLNKVSATWQYSGSYKIKKKLLSFIKAVRENHDLKRLKYQPTQVSALETAATGAFEIGYRMRAHSWNDVEAVLEIYLEQVAKGKSGWDWE